MKVIVDTCVWSLALRRRRVSDDRHVGELAKLVEESRVQLLGPIRQELLSGVRSTEQFEVLRERLRAFSDLESDETDFERAAEYLTTCRAGGIQGSNTDFLICALSHRHEMPIYTIDGGFSRYSVVLPMTLYRPRQ